MHRPPPTIRLGNNSVSLVQIHRHIAPSVLSRSTDNDDHIPPATPATTGRTHFTDEHRPWLAFPRSTSGEMDSSRVSLSALPAHTRADTLSNVSDSKVSDRAVKVTIVGINYAPEPTGIAPYTTAIAEGLAKRGHNISVITGYPHYPYWKRGMLRSPFRSIERIHGVQVRRLRHYVPAQPTWINRSLMEVTFGLQAITARRQRSDVVIFVTPALFASGMAAIRERLTRHRAGLGILIQDVYSRGVAETGAASGLAAKAVGAIESLAIRLCDGASVIHTGFIPDLTDTLAVNPQRIRVIRNWTHVSTADPAASAAFREAHGWRPDEIVVLHAGNMGYKQGLENVVAAASLAGESKLPARFVLLGDGNQRTSLEAMAKDVPALQFLPPLDEAEFPAALGAADVLLVNERPGIAHMSVPSKLTSYFKAGRPILAATDAGGLTAVELSNSGAGVRIPADDPNGLLTEALRLGSDTELATRLGKAGQLYCAQLLSEEAAIDQYEQWILDLAKVRRSRNRRAS